MTEPRGARAGHLTLLALLVLTAIGGVLRLRPAGFGLPQLLHYDEKHSLDELDLLRGDPAVARADPRAGIYPQLVPRLTALLEPHEVVPAPGPLAEQLAAASRDLLTMRRIAALFALLAVPGTWFLARRFVDPGTALLATALMATSVLHVWYSNMARPHGPASGLMLLAIVGALAIRRRGDALAYLGTGLAAGLAIGASQASLTVVPAVALAHLLRPRSSSRLAHVWFAAALALMLACAWCFCPNWFGGARQEVAPVSLMENLFSGEGLGRVARGLWHFEPLLIALALAAVVAWAVLRVRGKPPAPLAAGDEWFLRRWLAGREDLAIVLVHTLPYALVIAIYKSSSQRYFLQLLPYAIVLAAWVVRGSSLWLARRCAAGAGRSAVALAAPLALVALETSLALRVDAICLAPDGATRAARWIEEHCDPKSTRIAVLLELDLPLLREPAALASHGYGTAKQTVWARYQGNFGERERGATTWKLFSTPLQTEEEKRLLHDDPAAYLHRLGAEYVVVKLDPRTFLAELIASIRTVSTRVARFSPMAVDRGDDTPFLWWDQQNEYTEGFSWLWRMLHAQSLGGVVEIYRVN